MKMIHNPYTSQPIDEKTLRKHFRLELDQGHTKADATVAKGLYINATTKTETYPGGIPVAQIFWLKTRARWKPPEPDGRNPPQPPAPTPADMDNQDIARRMAFLLSRGAADAEHEKKKEPTAPRPKKKVTQPA